MKKTKKPEMFQKMQSYSPRFHSRFRNMMKLVKKEFGGRKDMSVLDAGCGTGTLMSQLEMRGYKVEGFDVDRENVEISKKRVNGSVSLGNILTYRPGKRYDLVFCGEVLEHIKDDSKSMKNLRDMLKDGGLLVLSVPNDPQQWTKDDEMGGHVRRYTVSELEKKLGRSGFGHFRSRYVGWPLVKRFMYGKRFREEKLRFQKEPSTIKKIILRAACFIERLDDLFNTSKGDKIVMSCKAL